ncbi:MAG: 2-C-methyl-D-erythritol 4-phosphate cytidylyltransferase [Candidatus Limivivens sp.]|nr:2-C-methyl-D-erythritol 4-phosphate cytidylyltransferase [Candidatus Limivivens sp.]
MEREKNAAIVLAAGQGRRMHSKVQKQYLLIQGKPVLYYSLKQFQDCPFMDEIILVTGEDEIAYCQKEIVERFGFTKVTRIVPGGAERFHSVYNGLCAIDHCDFVYIHDGARPFVDQEMLKRARADVKEKKACVAGMPVKDTIKISDGSGFAVSTPQRSLVWMVQTPQVFDFSLIYGAYQDLIASGRSDVTDDAMVLECMTGRKVWLTEGSYRNLKITTPEDLEIAEIFAESIGS